MEDAEEDDKVTVPCWADLDCADQCSSSQHASQLITAITKASSWQAMLFLSRCHNFGRVSDELGRTALHVAASCGSSSAVIKMLVKCSNLLAQDAESGWTALHRAVFYGHLSAARFLIAVCCSHYFCLHVILCIFLDSVIVIVICNMCLQYFDAVGWAAGRASGL